MKTGQDFNCLDLRRAKLADPGRLPAGAEAHLRNCTACQRFVRELDTNERRIEEALQVPVPDGLADRVMLRVRDRPASRPWRSWAMAATVALSFAVGMQEFRLPAGSDDASEAIRHVLHEPESFNEHRLADPAQFKTVLANFGGTLEAPIGRVLYMKLCPVPGGTGWHVVLQTEYGPATLILMPGRLGEPLPEEIRMGGYVATVARGGQGYYALVAESEQALAALRAMLATRVRWNT